MAAMPSTARPTQSRGTPCSAQYSIKSSFFGGHYEIRPRDSEQLVYYVNCLSFTLSRPSVIVHAGSSTAGRVVGGCKLKSFSRDIEVGLGDLNQPASVKWERMLYTGVWSHRYAFRVAFGSGRPQNFTWKRTHSWGSGGSGDYKLVNEESQTVVAVFEGSRTMIWRPGYLNIFAHDYGEQFNFMVLITLIALHVATSRGSSGGGGGGGA